MKERLCLVHEWLLFASSPEDVTECFLLHGEEKPAAADKLRECREEFPATEEAKLFVVQNLSNAIKRFIENSYISKREKNPENHYKFFFYNIEEIPKTAILH